MDLTQKRLIQTWIKKFVIQMNICPFAEATTQDSTLDYFFIKHQESEEFRNYCQNFMESTFSNSIIYFNESIDSFQVFLNLQEFYELELESLSLEASIKVIPFHPLFQFQDSNQDDRINYVNRSPVPFFHIIKEEVLNLPHIKKLGLPISFNNEKRLNSLSDEDWKYVLDDMRPRHKEKKS